MEIETKYAVRLFFSNPTFTQIYFEAIANALDAHATEISIAIETDGTIKPERLQIRINNNGEGFNDKRFDRFARLQKPHDDYHKGLGRLVYLRYFSTVAIQSVFNGRKRAFVFSEDFDGESEVTEAADYQESGSDLLFKNFIGGRLKSYDDIRPAALKEKILEHFLPQFLERKRAGKEFLIRIELRTEKDNPQRDLYSDIQTIDPSDVPHFEEVRFQDKTVDAFAEFQMLYMVKEGAGRRTQLTAVSIDGRTVPISLLGPSAIPADCWTIFIFKSDLFQGRSDSARQRLELPDKTSEDNLHRAFRRQISTVLAREVPAVEERNKKTKKLFEDRYPHLTGLFEKETVGIIDRNEALNLAQNRFFEAQKQVLESTSLDDETFRQSLEVSSRTLTEYILYRELIIKKLRNMDQGNPERDVHDLIVPRYRTFQNDGFADSIYNNNAWLLDDKFMTFRTILSEARMEEVVSAVTLEEEIGGGDGRPDLAMVFSADPDQGTKVDVVVVEIKKRAPDDKENTYAATQLVTRARKLVDHCKNIQRVWYFAILEIDGAQAQLLRDLNWTPLFSKDRVFYQDFQINRSDGPPIPTPVYFMSYDAVIQDAAARNHTFLEILKSDIKKALHSN